jgi:PAP2 superfamily
MKRLFVFPLAAGALVAGCSDGPTSTATKTVEASLSASTAAAAVNPVIQWNRIVLEIVRTPGVQPATIHSTWDFAILHASIYDAVNSITRRHQPYKVQLKVASDASQEAATISAAHEVLTNLYEQFRPSLDSLQQASLAAIPDGREKREGVRIGRLVADSILALRANDGSHATPPLFDITGAPGTWQPMPPNFQPQPQLTQWGDVTPFVLTSSLQFPLGPPPALTSARFIADFNEVKRKGQVGSTFVTADQATQGKFWNGQIQDYWQEIAQTAAIAHHLDTEETARLFALLDLSLADAVIAYFKSKYQYGFWRPVTAIREAGVLHNPALQPDTTWLPEVGKTTPDPSYPGAHAADSWASAEVLVNFFATDNFSFSVTSEVLPGVTRSFTTFEGAAQDAADSRIFAGQHYRTDENAGHEQGFRVADYIVDNFLK